MRITSNIIESLKNQGVYVSMFPTEEARQKAYEARVKKNEKDYRFVGGSVGMWDEEKQEYVYTGEERPDLHEYAVKMADEDFGKTCAWWGMWYDATVVYIRKGDVFCKRTVKKSQDITEEYVMKVLEKEQKAYSGAYGDFAVKVQRLFADKLGTLNGWVYPTTYGIGVWVFYNWKANECCEAVASVLDGMGIEYRNEFSDAKLVYRFVISKKEVNRNKLAA